MRLTCPNCGAQYEVARDAVPAEGRDVQCSNCGVTWLAMPEPAKEPQGTVSPPAPRSTITPEIAEILRAEAEREAAARRRDGTAGAPAATPQQSQAVVSPFEDEDDDTEIDFTPDDGRLSRGEGFGRRLDSREIWEEEGDFDWTAFADTQSASSREAAAQAESEAAELAEPSVEADAQENGAGDEAMRDQPDDAPATMETPAEAAMPDATGAPGEAVPRRRASEEDNPFASARGDDDGSDMSFDEETFESDPELTDYEPEHEAVLFDETDDLDDPGAAIEQDPFRQEGDSVAETAAIAEPDYPAEEMDDLAADEPLVDDPAEGNAQRLAGHAADDEPEDGPFDSPRFDEEPFEDAQPEWQDTPRSVVTEREALNRTDKDDPFGRALAEAADSDAGRPFETRDEGPEADPFKSAPFDDEPSDDTHPERCDALRPAVTEREAIDETEEDDPFARALAEAAESDWGRPFEARDEAPQDDPFAATAEALMDDDPDGAPRQPMVSDAQEEWDDPNAEARQRATLAATSTGAVTRRDLLPDIEEINSSLRSTSMHGGPARPVEAEDVQHGRGFRLGFGVALLFAAAMALVYSHAGRIGTALPPLAPVLDAYAGAVDAMRIGLDNWLRGLIDALG